MKLEDLLLGIGVVIFVVVIFYAMTWIFMYAWNYLVDYFGWNIPHLSIWAAFLIIVLISYFKKSKYG